MPLVGRILLESQDDLLTEHADLLLLQNATTDVSGTLTVVYDVAAPTGIVSLPGGPGEATQIEIIREPTDLDSFALRLYNLINPVVSGER